MTLRSPLDALKASFKSRLDPDTLAYNVLAWGFGLIAGKPTVRRNALIRARKDSSFTAEELGMASLLPAQLLDAVQERWRPRSLLDIGCGVGRAMQYLSERGVECVGLEGSQPAIDASPVRSQIQRTNLNRPVALGRTFDVVWSYEVAEHIHAKYVDAFLETLTTHGPVIVMSAAQPGQGGCGHFNEQPPEYWIAHIERRGFRYAAAEADALHALSDEFARNMMVFVKN
jgi:SAM-dependent methyltransferase